MKDSLKLSSLPHSLHSATFSFTKLAYTGWIAVQRDVYIDHDLESSPLYIKTNSAEGSNSIVKVWFYTASKSGGGAIYFYIKSLPSYELYHCLPRKNFPTALPSATDKVWKITLTKTSGIRLVIHCNDVEVLNVLLSDSTCNDSNWESKWGKDIEKMKFRLDDTASNFYSLQPPFPGKSVLFEA